MDEPAGAGSFVTSQNVTAPRSRSLNNRFFGEEATPKEPPPAVGGSGACH